MTVTVANKYDVGGVALDRPFKIRRLGHFGFNAGDVEACTRSSEGSAQTRSRITTGMSRGVFAWYSS